jgi:hypothetical protein
VRVARIQALIASAAVVVSEAAASQGIVDRQVVQRAIPPWMTLIWPGLRWPGDGQSSPVRRSSVCPLCTSLTRANRELAVVHARPLPDAL